MALLSDDALAAAAASLALSRATDGEDDAGGGGYSSGGGGAAGYGSPERGGGSGGSSPTRAQRWLGRALPGSPSRRDLCDVCGGRKLAVGGRFRVDVGVARRLHARRGEHGRSAAAQDVPG